MNGKIICNASPIIFLSKTGRINLLNDLFGEIYIPYGVWDEITRKNDGVTECLLELRDFKKVALFTVKNVVAVSAMIGRLHRGEAEVIVGAGELQIPGVILDDGYARSKAKQMGLDVIGTLGILIAGAKKGHINDLPAEINKLRMAGFRISDFIIETIIKS
jgi:predicted nucleic acid-binding protein